MPYTKGKMVMKFKVYGKMALFMEQPLRSKLMVKSMKVTMKLVADKGQVK